MNMFKKEKVNPIKGHNVPVTTELVLANDMINICTDASSICWDKPIPNDFERRCKYIGARVNTGHESVIEHSNLITLAKLPIKDSTYTLLEFFETTDYLRFKTVVKDDNIYILMGGSIRAYKHCHKNIKNPANTIIASNKEILKYNIPKQFFNDLIKDGIILENECTEFVENPFKKSNETAYSSKYLDIINIDALSNEWLKELTDIGFTYRDICDMLTVTVLFKNMSRTCTHQLVRHRNAITQESQRYVNYSEACFASPDMFKDKYDGCTYNTKIFDRPMSMQEIGTALTSVYSDMIEAGVEKEDARAFLPSNVQCRKLYMTYTLTHLINFIELRTDKHAQAEIRTFAKDLQTGMGISDDDLLSIKHILLDPYYKVGIEEINDYSNIDEVLETTEEIDPDSEIKEEAKNDVGLDDPTDVEEIMLNFVTSKRNSVSTDISKF